MASPILAKGGQHLHGCSTSAAFGDMLWEDDSYHPDGPSAAGSDSWQRRSSEPSDCGSQAIQQVYVDASPTSPEANVGLGAIQPDGRDDVLQQWAMAPPGSGVAGRRGRQQ